ncbi:hypothetical protein MsAg5_07740 [Methanosarcinaceae archaeon Ag5]|uniref:Proline-rich transmembrane protein 3/4 domain-containing protein n=1 Tax=Methanolapillus africanus TaxID=3028297 RepID=A0AAE4MHX4_9EURY|nr:hypothetical protein [Methanosarcinaceae archaeon Ag5]
MTEVSPANYKAGKVILQTVVLGLCVLFLPFSIFLLIKGDPQDAFRIVPLRLSSTVILLITVFTLMFYLLFPVQNVSQKRNRSVLLSVLSLIYFIFMVAGNFILSANAEPLTNLYFVVLAVLAGIIFVLAAWLGNRKLYERGNIESDEGKKADEKKSDRIMKNFLVLMSLIFIIIMTYAAFHMPYNDLNEAILEFGVIYSFIAGFTFVNFFLSYQPPAEPNKKGIFILFIVVMMIPLLYFFFKISNYFTDHFGYPLDPTAAYMKFWALLLYGIVFSIVVVGFKKLLDNIDFNNKKGKIWDWIRG